MEGTRKDHTEWHNPGPEDKEEGGGENNSNGVWRSHKKS